MAVRFLPPPEASHPAPGRPGDLAEVIDLRSRLPRPAGAAAGTATEHGAGEGSLSRDSGLAGTTPSEEVVGATSNEEVVGAPIPTAEAPTSSAFDDAVRLLARRSRSTGEVRDELRTLGHDAHEVELAVAACLERLYLDDLGLGRVLAERLRERKGMSRAQLRRTLRERRLEEGAIEAVLAEIDDDSEHELLVVAATQRAAKLRGVDRATAERRLLGFLARRGWSGEAAARAARSALDHHEGSDGVRFR